MATLGKLRNRPADIIDLHVSPFAIITLKRQTDSRKICYCQDSSNTGDMTMTMTMATAEGQAGLLPRLFSATGPLHVTRSPAGLEAEEAVPGAGSCPAPAEGPGAWEALLLSSPGGGWWLLTLGIQDPLGPKDAYPLASCMQSPVPSPTPASSRQHSADGNRRPQHGVVCPERRGTRAQDTQRAETRPRRPRPRPGPGRKGFGGREGTLTSPWSQPLRASGTERRPRTSR